MKLRLAALDKDLAELVSRAAREADVPTRPLHLQALLQLPCLADVHGMVSTSAAKDFLDDLAGELPARREWVVRNAASSPRDLLFRDVDTATSDDVMRRFHYLRSPRNDGQAYGLFSKAGGLVAVCVCSPLDVLRLDELLTSHDGGRAVSPIVLSRVFAFEGAPPNTLSYLLARVARAEAGKGHSDLVTYVNPNMGFGGASYRASGWQVLGEEPNTTYRYLDGRYVTDRALAAMFGHHDDATYRRLLGPRFQVSQMPLAPLLVFHRRLSSHTARTQCITPRANEALLASFKRAS